MISAGQLGTGSPPPIAPALQIATSPDLPAQVPGSTSPVADSFASDFGTFMAFSAGAAVLGTVGKFIAAHYAARVQKAGIRMQVEQVNHQERQAEQAAAAALEREDKKVTLINQTSENGKGAKGLKEINTITNKNTLELANAQSKLAQTKAAIGQAKQTAKSEKLDTRKLDNFFDPRDPRLRYPSGTPVQAA